MPAKHEQYPVEPWREDGRGVWGGARVLAWSTGFERHSTTATQDNMAAR